MSKTNYTLSGFEEVTLEELQLKQANGELIKGKIYITQETGSDTTELQNEINDLSDRIDEVAEAIPATVNRYFTGQTETLFGETYYLMQDTKPTDSITNIDLNITATSQVDAQRVCGFKTELGISAEIQFLPQSTQLTIQGLRTNGNQTMYIFAIGYVLDDLGNKTELSRSEVTTLTETQKTYTFFLPIPEYTAPIGSRAVIEVMCYRNSGGSTHTARLLVDDDTMSRWSYSAVSELDTSNLVKRTENDAFPSGAGGGAGQVLVRLNYNGKIVAAGVNRDMQQVGSNYQVLSYADTSDVTSQFRRAAARSTETLKKHFLHTDNDGHAGTDFDPTEDWHWTRKAYVDSEILKNLPLRYYEPVIVPGSTMEVLELGGIELEPSGFYPIEALTINNEFRTLVKATDGIYSVVFKLDSFNTTEAGPKPQFEVLSKEILVEVT